MKMMTLAIGAICVSLGGLWLLQGLGVVHVRPILCFADCAPIQGSSAGWAIVGLLLVAAGVTAIFLALKGRAWR